MTQNLSLRVDEFATFAATLANGGQCPDTEERVFNNP